jgi:hypothetical protein
MVRVIVAIISSFLRRVHIINNWRVSPNPARVSSIEKSNRVYSVNQRLSIMSGSVCPHIHFSCFLRHSPAILSSFASQQLL